MIDPRRWSIGLRLTLFFFAVLCGTLCIVAFSLYDELTHQIWEKDEMDVRRAINVQLAIVRALDGENPPGSASGHWQQEWAEHAQLGSGTWLRLIAPDGTVYSQTSGLDVPADAFPVPKAKGALKRYDSRRDGHEVDLVLSATDVTVSPGRRWVMQGMFDVTRSQELLEHFRHRLVLVMAAAIALSSLLGWWLVHRSLSPLRAMSRRIAGIDADRLAERIADRTWPSDLRVLATSFDDMMRRLEASFAQLSRFSSDLAHEFRSPITNLVAAAGVMLSRERTNAEYQETLEVMVVEGERLSRMVSSMLFLARADNARQALHLEPVTARSRLLELAEVYQASAEEHDVRIEVDGDAPLLVDAMLLRRALSNLIVNALRYTAPGGVITLSATAAASVSEVSVSDTGSGIAAQHLPHIFERFYRADAARSSNESTGLGLAVVKSIVELHQGTVSVESQVGKGSRFSLHFPNVA